MPSLQAGFQMRELKTIQVIYKKSTYDIYIHKYRDPRMTRLVADDDPSVRWMLASHEENQNALAHVRAVLKRMNVRARWSYRSRREPFDDVDLVLAVGGDGTLLEAARSVTDDTPVLGLRSTPSQSVGFLCAGDALQCEELLDAYANETLPILDVSRIAVTHNGETVLPFALNDVLFSHVSPAATSRYAISLTENHQEQFHEAHRSSGLWVATAIGSTAAIHSAGGARMAIDDARLQFAVRELYKSGGDVPHALESGFFTSFDTLTLRSHMRRALLFFDGPWVKRPVYFGDTISFQRAEHCLRLVAPVSATKLQ
jgi:NAD+ kinase